MDSPGQGWRVEQGRLFVRDHARLPDLCLFGGQKGAPGRRIFLNLHRPRGRVRMVAFCSDEGRRGTAWRKSAIPVLLAAAFPVVEWFILARWSDVPAPLRWNACLVGFSFASVIASWWTRRKDLRIVSSDGPWHELSGVDPAAVQELDRISHSLKPPAEAP